jgi:alpha-L-fucosidase
MLSAAAKSKLSALCLLFPLTGLVASAQTNNPNETKAQKDARMKWWRDARFGMFIHWGLYAVPGGVWKGKETPWIGEWLMNSAKIPVADYVALTKQFDPEQFDAETWVKLAKAAGMKYIVITSKHHEGFAMFHTKVDGYNIFDATPFHRDPLKELAAACKREGIKLGFYYSQSQDWRHAGGAAYNGGHWDPAQDGSYDDYLRNVAVPQVKELLTEYGPVSVIWWDTPADMTPERANLFEPLLKLQPQIISNDRLGGPLHGDYGTPEQHIPAKGLGRDWETCMTINDTWGYKTGDHNFKSTETLLHNLVDVASKGGNYLLNVGPEPTGVIPGEESKRLLEMGAWLKTNGEAIYGTSASPFNSQVPWGRCTQKNGKLYLTVWEWPKDGLLHVPILNSSSKAWTLVGKTPLTTAATGTETTIQLPATTNDPLGTVIVLQPSGAVQAAPPPPPTLLRANSEGGFDLKADDVEISGDDAKVEGDAVKNVGFWTNAGDSVIWNLQVDQPGDYAVKLTYACDNGADGSEYTVAVDDSSVKGKVESTGSWGDYKTIDLGTIHVSSGGHKKLIIKPISMPHGAVMNLRAVTLKRS